MLAEKVDLGVAEHRGITEWYCEYFYMVSISKFQKVVYSNKNSANTRLSTNFRSLADLIGEDCNSKHSRENQVLQLFFESRVFALEENSIYQKRNSVKL